MKNFLFQKAILSRHIIISAAYYRLYLPNLLSNIDKIIYLDVDIITFENQKKMFDIDMKGFYLL